MFFSFWLPYIDREQGPRFHWVMFKQLASLGAEQVAFIGDPQYFAGVEAPWGKRWAALWILHPHLPRPVEHQEIRAGKGNS
jgi:hypothetical protein